MNNLKLRPIVIITIVTFIFYFVEALIHYNIGKQSYEFTMPTGKEMRVIIKILIVFSILTSITSEFLIENLTSNS